MLFVEDASIRQVEQFPHSRTTHERQAGLPFMNRTHLRSRQTDNDHLLKDLRAGRGKRKIPAANTQNVLVVGGL